MEFLCHVNCNDIGTESVFLCFSNLIASLFYLGMQYYVLALIQKAFN